jgi:hypothetical protein
MYNNITEYLKITGISIEQDLEQTNDTLKISYLQGQSDMIANLIEYVELMDLTYPTII